MQLHSLKIRNYRVLRKVDLEFGDAVIGIIGNNGVGKSSIVEAISWALYGHQAARSARDEIKSSYAAASDNCEVTLDFSIKGESYRVTRSLIGKRERPEVQLFRGEASESVGVTETRRYVGELLGLDWRGFLTSFLARQQELNALSDLPPARRRDHLAGMLGIERLDRVVARVKEEARLDREKAELLAPRLLDCDRISARIAELSLERSNLTRTVAELDAERSQSEKALRQTTIQYTKLQETRSVWSQLTAQMAAMETSHRQLRQRLVQLRAEADRLSGQAGEADSLKGRITELPVLKRCLDDLRATRGQLDLHQQLTTQLSELVTERKDLRQSLTMIRIESGSLKKELDGVPSDIEGQSDRVGQKLEEAREEYSRCRGQGVAVTEQISKLRMQMEQIANLGPDSTCDRCLRPLGDDLPSIRKHLNEEMGRLAQQDNEASQQLNTLKAEGALLKEESTRLQASETRQRELQIKQESLAKNDSELVRREEEISQRLADVTSRLDKVGPVEYDPEQFSRVEKQVSSLEDDEKSLNQLLGALARKPAVEKEIGDIKASIVRLDHELADSKEERESLDFSDKRFEESRSKFEEAQAKLEKVRGEFVAGSTKLEVMAKELESQGERLDDLNKIREQVDQLRDDQYYEQKLGSLFGEFREYLVSRIRPTLADFSSRLISEMTDGRYSMVELDDKYNLRLLDASQFYGIDRFSGGEKDLANLCLRLAISLALTESAGLDRSFIILDEVFGSQDSNRKELILSALCNLKQRFPQIILITHIEDIRDQVETLIEVVPDGDGWSRVEVHGHG
ncbi:MAG: SMC family ATPase [candidate division Zixibacteria bacterium]|nr:SMC family ATPase [candidate division Zixibacteria bacterium]